MDDSALLSIEAPGRLRASIRGPAVHPHIGVAGPSDVIPGFLSVEAEGLSPLVVQWFSPDGTKHSWLPGQPGPRFYEETRYRLIVEDLAGIGLPEVSQRDPSLIREVDRHVRQHLLAVSLNFSRQVGRTRIGITAADVSISLELEVFPTKLDYETDYHQLLNEVAAAGRGLALEYLRATFFRGGAEPAENPSPLEWLLLVRNEIDSIELALRYLASHPHRVLDRTIEQLPAHKVRRSDHLLRRAISRGEGGAGFLEIPSLGMVRMRLPTRQASETLNTPEHRWLRHQLGLVAQNLETIHTELVRISQDARSSGISARVRAETEEVASFVRRVHTLLALPVLSQAVGPPPLGSPSLTLLNGVGYRQAYRSIMLLRLGLGLDDSEVEFSVKDLHILYETWCFLRLVELVCRLTGSTAAAGDLIEASGGGVRIRLKYGQKSEISLDAGSRKLVLLYNPTYSGLTGDQRPDIVLEFREHGWPRIIVVFDAKYRLRSDQEYVKTFGSPGPPIDAVNALHRYRDAIVDSQLFGRPTVKGIALFPLGSEAAAQFKHGRLYAALDRLGIGALPFTPSNTGLVSDWLQHLLALEIGSLAVPGPPFLAWEHLHQNP